MTKIFSKTVLAVLAAAGLVLPAAAAVTGTKTLPGHVPAIVSQLTATGRMAATTSLQLAISLPVRDQAGLDARLQQIYDLASTNYHSYLTPAQFAAQFGATEQDYQAVVAFAQANGLTVTATHPNRLVLDVSGPVSAIENAFQIQLNVFNHPTEACTFYAPATEPVISASLPVLNIGGLDNYYRPHSKMIPSSQIPNAGMTPKVGSGPGGNYIGNDFRRAYVPGTTLKGVGQNVGLLQFDGFFANDISSYATLIGLTNPPQIIIVPIDGGVAFPGGGNGEVCLDIEMVLSMSPGVSNIYVYEAPNPSPWVDLLSRMANDNLAKQLSCSWGGGPPNAAAEQIFQQMALQGQTFFNASGDTDAFVDNINPATFPSESPNIVQVGGTVLTTGPNAAYTSEVVWNDRFPRFPGYQGSSGGISVTYPIPTWQQGISMASNHGSTTQRNMPDVALTALDVWLISDNGQSGSSGGTSAAAPLWAAFTALANQQAAISSRPPVGFINPAIYNLAKSANYTNVFHDTTVGDNTWPTSPTNFFAVAGFDLCTGLGTPRGTNLINALVGTGSGSNGPPTVIVSAPAGPWGTNLSVMNGSNPNGAWFLFVQDDAAADTGMITNGWFVNLTTADLVGQASDNAVYASRTNTAIAFAANYTNIIAVTNYGPSASGNVLVTDLLPLSGLSLVSSNHTAGVITVSGSTLAWSVGNLQTNAGATLTLVLHGNFSGTYTNTATVSATTTDPNPDDDTVVSFVTVTAPPSPPVLTNAVYGGSPAGFRFTVTGDTNYLTTVQASTNLINWVSLYSGYPTFTFTNFVTTNYPVRFYRALIGP